MFPQGSSGSAGLSLLFALARNAGAGSCHTPEPEMAAAAAASSDESTKVPEIRLALCKGRMKEGVFKMFDDAGIKVRCHGVLSAI